MPERQPHIRLGRLLATVLGVLAVAVIWAGLAWACTERAVLDALEPAAGPAKTKLTLNGNYFPEGGYVDVRLDSADGRPLGREDVKGSNGTFSGLLIEIPDLPPDVYRVIAFGYNAEGDLKGKAMRTFEILGDDGRDGGPPAPQESPGRSAAPGNLPDSVFTPGESGGPSGRGAANPPAAGTTTPGGGTTTPGGGTTTPRSAPSDRPTTGRSGSGGTALTRGAGDPGRNGGAHREGSADLGLVTAPSGQPLFRDSLASPALTDGRRSIGQPSGRSASGDLWSGFGSGRTPSLEPRRSDPAAEDGGFDIGLAAGTGFLGLGLAALFGSFLVAEVRRRRKAVRA